MIKTAVIGASGFIGKHLWRSYRTQFPDSVGTGFSADVPGLRKFDIVHPDVAALRLAETGHQAVLISAAKPNVAYCENNREAAYAVNVAGMLACIEQVARLGLQVIFLSSDYAFDGKAGPYSDTDATVPGTEYGRHKVRVEKALPDLTDNYLVLRLSKIYGLQKGDRTLIDEMAGLLAKRETIQAATDQRFSPTHVDDVVDSVHKLQALGAKGTLNLCSPEGFSRYEIATALAKAMGADQDLIKPISLHSLPSMASRPLDTRMRPSALLLREKPAFVPLQKSIDTMAALWMTRS